MSTESELPIVYAMTGASGAIYAVRTLQWLLEEGRRIHLIASDDARTVIEQELGFRGELVAEQIPALLTTMHRFLQSASSSDQPANLSLEKAERALQNGNLQVHRPHDYFSPVASGSYRTAAMVICPCSGTTLAAIAQANGRNLIHRAAEVHLKERRKLILVPRETPLSLMQIENMVRVTQAGAVVLPAAPGWYHGVQGISDLVDFIAARILDQLGIPHSRTRRWQS